MYTRNDIKDIYPLTPMQEGMLFHSMLDEGSKAYFEQTILEIEGEIDIELYEESLNRLIERYDVLRTVFIYEMASDPMQIVLKARKTNIHYEDITAVEEREKENYIKRFIETDRNKGFDLKKDILIRLAVIKVEERNYCVIWSFHHIIMDGWCMGIIMNDFVKIYDSLKHKKPIELTETYPYRQFIFWLQNQDKEKAKDYWRSYLEGYEETAVIPGKKRHIGETGYTQETVIFTLGEELTKGISELAKDKQVTLSTIFQTIWGIILQRYNGKEDVVFGSVVSGRPAEIAGIERMLGLFINTVPVRIKAHDKETFSQIVGRMQVSITGMKDYEYFPLPKIQSEANLKQNLIDHILVFENYPVEQDINKSTSNEKLGFVVKGMSAFEQTSYDFNIIISQGDGLNLHISYNGEVYDREFIENIGGHIKNVIRQVTADPEVKIEEIELIEKNERDKLLCYFNNIYATYPKNKTIHELFEDQVERAPDNIAVVYKDKQLTYIELNGKANQLSRMLREKGVASDTIVGIMVERSLEMIIGILGILKAGGAYLPIDPECPKDRIMYMMEDSGSTILITQKHLNETIRFDGEVIVIDCENLYPEKSNNTECCSNPNNIAYMIYTSGTTGKPKGTMIEHKNVVRLMINDKMQFDFNSKDVWTMFHSYCFDFSVWEMYGALLYGGRLVIIPKITAQDPSEYLKILKQESVTVLNQTPSAFYRLAEAEERYNDVGLTLRYVIFGGEALKPAMLESFHNKYKDVKLINMYGITETTVHVTYKEIAENEIKSNTSNIGTPIPTLAIYLMDKHLRLVPSGFAGELCIGGDGLARGYLNRPELTAEKFVVNPYKTGERIYRSGDLARMLPNGELEYLGRIDHQVKIRGFRIELGEIEAVLKEHPSVKQAVVIDRSFQHDQDTKKLVAYVVLQHEEKLADIQLRSFLWEKLPDYMVPSIFVTLDEIPLTANGKINTSVLPEPDAGRLQMEKNYVAPRTQMEKTLSEIWAKVLGLNKVGIHDNFFDIGGDSILSIKVAALVKQQGYSFSVQQLYQYRTIYELAQKAGELDETEEEIVQAFSLLTEEDSEKLFLNETIEI